MHQFVSTIFQLSLNNINWIFERLIFIKERVFHINHVVTVKFLILQFKKSKNIHDNAKSFFYIPVRCEKKSQIQTHVIFMPNLEIMLQNVSANCLQSLRYLIKYRGDYSSEKDRNNVKIHVTTFISKEHITWYHHICLHYLHLMVMWIMFVCIKNEEVFEKNVIANLMRKNTCCAWT